MQEENSGFFSFNDAVADLSLQALKLSPVGRRALGLVVFVTAVTAISLAAVAWTSLGSLTAIWPTNAIVLVTLLRGPRDLAWRAMAAAGAYAGITLAVVFAGAPVLGAALLSLTNMAEIGAALLLLRIFRLNASNLTKPGVLFGFLACGAVIAPALGASLAAPLVSSFSTSTFAEAWWDYWAADALGVVIFGSMGMVLTREHLRRLSRPADWSHGLVLLAALGAATAFLVQWDTRQLALVAPLAVWATLRFGPLGAAGSVLWTCVVAVALNLVGLGTVAPDDPNIRAELFQLQMALVVLPLITLPIAAVLAERDRAARQAQAADRAKSAFLANMSHEIRTPLNGVVAMAGLIAERATSAADRETAEIIRSSGEALERLLGDVLDLARIESGRVDIQQTPFEVREAVEATTLLMGLQAEAKGLRLTVDVSEAVGGARCGDPVRLRQVLGNLVSNAIKFTDRGEVEITVVAAEDEEQVVFRVRDTGVGFDPAMKERLFGRFEQADGSFTRRYGGSGVGLAIACHLVEAMGGRLDADSAPGLGSVFTVTLPLPVVEGAASAEADVPAQAEEAAPPRLLIVDDHPTNLKVAELILAQTGAHLVTATNGAEAVASFRTERFDAVLMDMQMPVMDGLEATRTIRSHERAQGDPPTPIIMVTANALPEHEEASRAAGADAFLTKPVNPALLLTTLQAQLNASAARLAA